MLRQARKRSSRHRGKSGCSRVLRIAFESLERRELLAVLQPGDANQDLTFDEADIIMAYKAAKYDSSAWATWAEGDWQGAPGGSPGDPPAGDGRFDGKDLLAAYITGKYRTGPYDASASAPTHARQPLVEYQGRTDKSDMILRYDARTGNLELDTMGIKLSTIQLYANAPILGNSGQLGIFDVNTSSNFFRLSSVGLTDVVIPGPSGMTIDQLRSLLTIDGSRQDGGGLGTVSLCSHCDPSPIGLGIVEGRVIDDRNANGSLDPGERGLNRIVVAVHLTRGFTLEVSSWIDHNHDGRVDPDTEAGFYWFGYIPAGTYLIQPIAESGDRITSPSQGPYIVEVKESETPEHLDFAVEAIPQLLPGDANQDYYFDEADLIRAFQSGTFLTGTLASWSDGDWSGGRGGTAGQPPAGDGRFNMQDLKLVDQSLYRAGAYQGGAGAPVNALKPLVSDANGDVTIRYDRWRKMLTVDPHGGAISTFHLTSQQGILDMPYVQPADELGQRFNVNTPHELFLLAWRDGLHELTIPVKERYTLAELLTDLRVDGSWRTTLETQIEYDPATGSLLVTHASPGLVTLGLQSQSSLFRLQQVDSRLFSGRWDVLSANELYKFDTEGFLRDGQPLLLEGILPTGLSLAELQNNLKVSGTTMRYEPIALNLKVKGSETESQPSGDWDRIDLVCDCGEGSGTIQGGLFHDVNGNHRRDPDEPPMSGWTMHLESVERGATIDKVVDGNDIDGNGVIDPSEQGTFAFHDLPAGEYRIRATTGFDLPTTGETFSLTLGVDQQLDNLWLPVAKSAIIRGQVFHDINRNGIHELGEPGLNDHLVTIGDQSVYTASVDLNRDGFIDPMIDQGWYQLQVFPSIYRMRAQIPDRWGATTPAVLFQEFREGTVAIPFGMSELPRGDVNGDFLVDVNDIDRLLASLRDPQQQTSAFDLNDDTEVTYDDVRVLVGSILHTSVGDANLDGTFDSGDLVLLWQQGEFEDDLASNSTWAEGDWNGDGEFDTHDLIFAMQDGAYAESAAAIAEDDSIAPLALATVVMPTRPTVTDRKTRPMSP